MRILDRFPDHASPSKRYDWNVIFDGHIRELEPGIDFVCQPGSLVRNVRIAARKRGIAVQVRHYTRPEDEQIVVAVQASVGESSR